MSYAFDVPFLMLWSSDASLFGMLCYGKVAWHGSGWHIHTNAWSRELVHKLALWVCGISRGKEERKGSIRENTHDQFKPGKAFFICLYSVQTVDSREPQVTFYNLGGLENPSLGSVLENKPQNLSSYPLLVSISLNNAGLLGGGRVSEWGLGHICLWKT